jgi:hypothetical protein
MLGTGNRPDGSAGECSRNAGASEYEPALERRLVVVQRGRGVASQFKGSLSALSREVGVATEMLPDEGRAGVGRRGVRRRVTPEAAMTLRLLRLERRDTRLHARQRCCLCLDAAAEPETLAGAWTSHVRSRGRAF